MNRFRSDNDQFKASNENLAAKLRECQEELRKAKAELKVYHDKEAEMAELTGDYDGVHP